MKSGMQRTLRISVAFICLLSILCCTAYKKVGYGKVRSVILTATSPVGVSNDSMIHDSDRIILHEYGYGRLQQIPVKRFVSNKSLDSSGNVVGDSLISLPDGTRYFYYTENHQDGIIYDTASPKQLQVLLADKDSVLQANTITNMAAFLTTILPNQRLIASKVPVGYNAFADTYVPLIKKNKTYGDSTILTYEHSLQPICFSFSEPLDRQRGAKLVKVQMKYNQRQGEADDLYHYAQYISVQMRDTVFSAPASLITLFERMEQMRKTAVFKSDADKKTGYR